MNQEPAELYRVSFRCTAKKCTKCNITFVVTSPLMLMQISGEMEVAGANLVRQSLLDTSLLALNVLHVHTFIVGMHKELFTDYNIMHAKAPWIVPKLMQEGQIDANWSIWNVPGTWLAILWWLPPGLPLFCQRPSAIFFLFHAQHHQIARSLGLHDDDNSTYSWWSMIHQSLQP